MSIESDQMRAATRIAIDRNPSRVFFFIDGILYQEVIRFVHESASVPANKTTPVGLGTSFSMFCQMKYNSLIKENTVLWTGTVGWKVGPVDDLRHNNIIYSKRAPVLLVKPSSLCAISSFKIGAAIGVINNTLGTIVVTVPAGTDVSALNPVIVHNGKMINKTGVQDFTNPVSYIITAEDLTFKTYTVTVEVLP